MKKLVKASTGSSKVKVIYGTRFNTSNPELRSMTVAGSSPKEALMGALTVLNLNYLGVKFSEAFDEPDRFSLQELIDAVEYQNGHYVDDDYIFSLDIDGQNYIDQTGPEENYRAEELL